MKGLNNGSPFLGYSLNRLNNRTHKLKDGYDSLRSPGFDKGFTFEVNAYKKRMRVMIIPNQPTKS